MKIQTPTCLPALTTWHGHTDFFIGNNSKLFLYHWIFISWLLKKNFWSRVIQIWGSVGLLPYFRAEKDFFEQIFRIIPVFRLTRYIYPLLHLKTLKYLTKMQNWHQNLQKKVQKLQNIAIFDQQIPSEWKMFFRFLNFDFFQG